MAFNLWRGAGLSGGFGLRSCQGTHRSPKPASKLDTMRVLASRGLESFAGGAGGGGECQKMSHFGFPKLNTRAVL